MVLRICFNLMGLGVDEAGHPTVAGVSVDFGEVNKDIPYDQLVADINKEALLKMVHLDSFSPDDVTFITPEEYDKEYGADA